MIRLSLVCFLIIAAFSHDSSAKSTSSDTVAFVNSQEVIKAAIALHDEGKYDLAIEKFLSIPESDTNYVMMRTELINSYIQNEEYEKAIQIGESTIKAKSAFKSYLYSSLGSAYDEKGQPDKAIEIYQKGLDQYPYDYLLHYNLGVTWMKKEAYQKAIEQFEKAITLNPYHGNSHLYLGNIMIIQGKKTRAMLCLGTYIALFPNNNNALVLLNNLLKNSLEIENTAPEEEKLTSFYQLDLLIKSNAALDKKFKSAIDFKAPVAQQMELLLESLVLEETSDDFWMRFYVPLYTQIYQNELKEAFIYYLLTSTDDKGVAKWLKSNEKELSKFYDLANQHLKAFRSKRRANIRDKKGLYSFWYYDNHRLNAIGNQKDEETYYGPWVFYYTNGEVSAEGDFLENGNKTGKWNYYYVDGTLKKQEEYDENGTVNSTIISYYGNGKVHTEIPYKADQINGLVKIYYPCGQLKETLMYKGDERHGPGTVYYKTGEINSQYTYDEGLLVGAFTYFYKNGHKKEVYTYVAGKLEGPYEFYYKSGKISQKGQYKADKMTGEWIGYYEDGSDKFKGNEVNGFRTGIWYNYNLDGTLLSEETYGEEGNLNGSSKYYTDKGQLHYEYTYKEGMLVGYKYFNQNHEIVSEGTNAKGNFNMKGFYPDGVLNFEGRCQNGKMDGTFTYYYHNGNKRSIISFKDDKYDGLYQYFYETGQKMTVSHYENGVENGYYQSFYRNGQVQTEGWIVDGTIEQTWINYYPDGTISNKQYYLNGETNGYYEDYDGYGRLLTKSKYSQGLLTHKLQYDTLGTIIRSDSLDFGNGKYVLSYADKSPRFEVEMSCSENTSDMLSFYKNGKVNARTPIKNGAYNGHYQAYYPNRKLRVEGDYVNHEQTGLWTWYFRSGKKDSEIYLKDGKADGKRTDYYENGKIKWVGNYKNGDRNGNSSYYAPDGTLQIEKKYDEYGIVSYRYLNANNEFTPFQPLENQDGNVIAYYPNGKISVDQHYKNGLLEGTQIQYYPSGNIQQKRQIVAGDEEGIREDYYPNGQLKKKASYEYDDLHGLTIEYYESGTVKRKTSYMFGEKEGWEETYNADGKLISREYYRDDYNY